MIPRQQRCWTIGQFHRQQELGSCRELQLSRRPAVPTLQAERIACDSKKIWFVCDFLEAQNRKGTESGLGLAGLSENWRTLFCLFIWDEDYTVRVIFYLVRYFSSESFNLKSLMILVVLAL